MAFFNPNLIGTQSTSVAPKIVPWSGLNVQVYSHYIFPTQPAQAPAFPIEYFQPSGTPGQVTEGQYAWAAFQFVDPANPAVPKEQMDPVKLAFSITGATANDYYNNGQLWVYPVKNLSGSSSPSFYVDWTRPLKNPNDPPSSAAKTSWTDTNTTAYTLVDQSGPLTNGSNPDPAVGTGVWGFVLATPIAKDTLIETGDKVLFQVSTSDHTHFTDSANVQSTVDIIDAFTASTRPKWVVGGAAPTLDDSTASLTYSAGNIRTGYTGIVNFSTFSSPIEYLALNGNQPVHLSPDPTGATVFDHYSANPAAVKEGQLAVAKFSLVESALSASSNGTLNVVASEYPTQLKVSFVGASAEDFVPNSFKVFAESVHLQTTELTISQGQVTLPINTQNVYLSVLTRQDKLVEEGDEINFQIGKVDVNSFFESDYVEKKIKLVDHVNTFSYALNSPFQQNTVYATSIADEFVLTQTMLFGSPPAVNAQSVLTLYSSLNGYDTISSFGEGDRIKVDIYNNDNPSLNLVNFGTLKANGTTPMPESTLTAGLRQLDGVEALRGGVYVMGATDDNTTTVNTYVIIDTNNDGKLTLNSVVVGNTTESADVFVKLAGVAPSSMQSTHFLLV